MYKYYLFFMVLCFVSCDCKDQKSDAIKEPFVSFMIKNILIGEEFSLPSYQPLKDMKGNTYTLDSILKKPFLFFRFSEYNCEMCIQSEIDLINKLDSHNMIIGLASYKNSRTLAIAKEKYNIQFPIYQLSYEESQLTLPFSLEGNGTPYLFFINTDFKAKHIFIPSKELPEISTQYYMQIFDLIKYATTEPLLFEFKEVDLGDIQINQTQKIEFEYTNRTSDSLLIESVDVSCDCLVSHWDKNSLEKNKTSKLTISFIPNSLGYTIKKIVISYNQSKKPIQLMIKANVIN